MWHNKTSVLGNFYGNALAELSYCLLVFWQIMRALGNILILYLHRHYALLQLESTLSLLLL